MDALGNITTGPPLYFTRKELPGVPDELIAKLAKDNGQDGNRYAVSIDDLDIVSQCNNATTRQVVWLQGNRLVPENIDRLKQTIALRAEQANLLGYPSYAAYALQDTLIANPENVRSFIDQIDAKLQPLNREQYIGILKGLKKEEEGTDEFLFEWDQDYYESKAKAAGMKKRQSKEPNSSEYYEAIETISRMLEVLGPVFHFRFEKLSAVTTVPGHSAKDVVWNPSVQLYAVYDTDDNSPVGHLYVDPYHRDSDDALASTAYTISTGSSFVKSDGTRNPISVVVKYYFDAPNGDQPTLLDSDQLHLLFRLFGSVLSSFSGKVKYNALSAVSSAIPSDFSNVIQSTLEGWSNDPQTLERISEHWSYVSPEAQQAWQKANPNQPQPPKQIPQNSPAGSTDSNPRGLSNGHNVWFALYSASLSAWDQYLYGQSHPVDTTSLDFVREFKRISKQYRKLDHIGDTGVTDTSKWDYPFTYDSHNMQTPGSVYDYSLSWLYAADLFSRFQEDPFSTSIGGQFRTLLLVPGASEDYEAQIETFLGRKLDFGKYLGTLGVH
ncbi:unnamed protein product [Cercospora beticola]|nr:unnamed protein product [Cercospora beticola]